MNEFDISESLNLKTMWNLKTVHIGVVNLVTILDSLVLKL